MITNELDLAMPDYTLLCNASLNSGKGKKKKKNYARKSLIILVDLASFYDIGGHYSNRFVNTFYYSKVFG